ncbi:MAG: zinc-finger domain-containing protein [Pseudomonadota bacterium]|nr:zinc-finger domain-containing protein [Pseudomonadota bacterium]
MGDKVSSHPKVYLPIEKSLDKTIQCPYCSTVYVLVNDEN